MAAKSKQVLFHGGQNVLGLIPVPTQQGFEITLVNRDLRKILLLLPAGTIRGPDDIPQVGKEKPGHERVKVDRTQYFAASLAEKDVRYFSIMMHDGSWEVIFVRYNLVEHADIEIYNLQLPDKTGSFRFSCPNAVFESLGKLVITQPEVMKIRQHFLQAICRKTIQYFTEAAKKRGNPSRVPRIRKQRFRNAAVDKIKCPPTESLPVTISAGAVPGQNRGGHQEIRMFSTQVIKYLLIVACKAAMSLNTVVFIFCRTILEDFFTTKKVMLIKPSKFC